MIRQKLFNLSCFSITSFMFMFDKIIPNQINKSSINYHSSNKNITVVEVLLPYTHSLHYTFMLDNICFSSVHSSLYLKPNIK